jgi:hypothetical protein
MSICTAHRQSIGNPAEVPGRDVTTRSGLTLLSDRELDRIAAAGSKPGCVGDGRAGQPHLPKTC